ncbi:glycosyltransferase [Herbiconiux sp. SYSU D00978]|uniref:glycosyltransferase n=1 Tax=Herbiconiux sp. SYSU D00978 TaxID=2812562 RepID=UPI001A966B25|nr:glycosyltransferase [Herbiconiux sp. SYSU D00978]
MTLYLLQSTGPLEHEVAHGVRLEVVRFWRGPRRSHDAIVTGTTNTEVAFGLLARLARRTSRWLIAIHNPVGPGAPLPAPLVLLSCTIADSLIALTSGHARGVEHYWGVRPDMTVSNAIDTSKYRRQSDRALDWDVGYIGRLAAEHKGLDRLLAAAAAPEAERFRFAIAGSGPDEQKLKRLAASLGIDDRISWLGHQSPEWFLPRVGLLTLLSRYEGQPLVLLEAEAAGVPQVVSADAGVDPGAAKKIVDADDANAVAEAWRDTLTSRSVTALPISVVNNSPTDMARGYLAALSADSVRIRRIRNVATFLHALFVPKASGGAK